MKYELKNDYIELFKLLKTLDLVDSGGQAKMLISEGHVFKNEEIETRKRAKVCKGDIVKIADVIIEII